MKKLIVSSNPSSKGVYSKLGHNSLNLLLSLGFLCCPEGLVVSYLIDPLYPIILAIVSDNATLSGSQVTIAAPNAFIGSDNAFISMSSEKKNITLSGDNNFVLSLAMYLCKSSC